MQNETFVSLSALSSGSRGASNLPGRDVHGSDCEFSFIFCDATEFLPHNKIPLNAQEDMSLFHTVFLGASIRYVQWSD